MDIAVQQARPEHYERIVDYFSTPDVKFLNGMGVDPEKIPARKTWLSILAENHPRPPEEKSLFYVIWYLDDEPIGHSNINKIMFGKEAYMHLHMWRSDLRKNGLGFEFIKKSIPYYFQTFGLQNLYCEPYALNPAPNNTLKKIGFEFIKEYETTPGPISFPQPVNRWCLSENRFHEIFTAS